MTFEKWRSLLTRNREFSPLDGTLYVIREKMDENHYRFKNVKLKTSIQSKFITVALSKLPFQVELDELMDLNHYIYKQVTCISPIMTRKREHLTEKQALKYFQHHGGVLSFSDVIRANIHPRTLSSLQVQGDIKRFQRGLYGVSGLPNQRQPDLAIISKKIPNGVLCLISALYFHELTTEIPHYVYIALKKGYVPPQIDYPPVKFHWFSSSMYEDGIEKHEIDSTIFCCYSKEKTVVDCFRFRNKLGIDVAIEALKKYWRQGHPKLDLLTRHARIGRVEKVMKPYIEAVINES